MRRCNRKAVSRRPESQRAQHVRNVQIIGAMPVDSALSAPYHPRSFTCPGGGIGRRAGFRCQFPQGSGSSSLLLGTILLTI
ncbi:hypothetical protein OCEANICA350_12190 [Oceanicaulis sp. 350]|nr:hypothetical protein OCEANICA350_12190 [Oceanicaulis sp. 350]